jgi:hypothetical protein
MITLTNVRPDPDQLMHGQIEDVHKATVVARIAMPIPIAADLHRLLGEIMSKVQAHQTALAEKAASQAPSANRH